MAGETTKVYLSSNGDALTVASGGTLTMAGTADITGTWKISGTTVTATASQLNAAAAGASSDLDLGNSTTPTAGSLDIFPATSGGATDKLTLTATTNAANRGLAITNAAVGQATNLVIPDPGDVAGQFVLTNSAHKLIVNCNTANRTLSLAGNVSLAGALTTTGAYSTTFVMPAAHTYTFPDSDCTLGADPTSGTGTTSATYTIDSDSATGTFVLRSNSVAGTNHSVTLQAPTTTQAVVLTLPDVASDTITSSTNTATLTNKTLTAPVINGATTAAAANNFALHTGSGTFTTPTGTFTFYGAISTNGNNNYNFGGSSGTFATPTGTCTLSGATNLAANRNLTCSAGTTALDFSSGTGITKTTTGACTFYGSSHAMSGNGTWDLSASNGTFKTTTGTNTLAGNTVIADGKYLKIGSATAGVANALQLYSATAANGSLILHQPDNAGNFATTIQPIATMAQATTITIPDPGGVAGTVVLSNSANAITFSTSSARTVTLGGNFTTATAAVTLTANAAGSSVTLPQSGTLATLAGAEALTNKTIDGDDNTISDLSPTVAKVAVRGNATPTAAVPAIPFVLSYLTDDNAEAAAIIYTVPVGKTMRVLRVDGVKIVQAGGAAGTLTVQNGATAITNDIDLNIADKTTFAAGTLDDAQLDIAAGDSLKVTTATAAGCKLDAIVNVTCVWV